MTRTEVVRSEGVVCLSDIGRVSTEDGCWVGLICEETLYRTSPPDTSAAVHETETDVGLFVVVTWSRPEQMHRSKAKSST